MRILVYLLSLLMFFAPTYSAYASGISKGQIVKMGKQGGALVKTAGGKLVKLGKVGHPAVIAGSAVWGFCSKYPKKCKDYAGDAVEIACDISGVCTAERKEDDPEYPGKCYSADGFKGRTPYLACRKALDAHYKDSAIEELRPIKHGPHDVHDCIFKPYNVQIIVYKDDPKNCEYLPQDNQLNQQDLNNLAKKIAEKMDDDDIKNYYNTDYDDITINNYHYYGDDIDNETNIDNQCQNNSCNEISKEIEKDIQNKKYDIDDVTPANCTMEENTGKYIACNMKIENEDEENNTNKEGDTNKKESDDTDIPKKEDDDPLSCDSSKFHKKVCEWMDWTQDDLEVPDEDNPKIKDLAEDLVIKKDRVRFNAQCPSPKEISITVSGQGFSDHLNYQPFCDLMTKSKPFVVGISGISALLIVAGSLRR